MITVKISCITLFAIAHLKNGLILILMDCEMPVMDGYEATEKIRDWEQKKRISPIPIVALTAHVMPEYLERCLISGMNDFLLKPIDMMKLKGVLSKV